MTWWRNINGKDTLSIQKEIITHTPHPTGTSPWFCVLPSSTALSIANPKLMMVSYKQITHHWTDHYFFVPFPNSFSRYCLMSSITLFRLTLSAFLTIPFVMGFQKDPLLLRPVTVNSSMINLAIIPSNFSCLFSFEMISSLAKESYSWHIWC